MIVFASNLAETKPEADWLETCSCFLQTRMQSLQPEPSARYRNVMDALRQIVRTEGLWRPIRGVNVLAVGAGPAHALYFACYEKIKFSLSDAIHPGANSHFANGEQSAADFRMNE